MRYAQHATHRDKLALVSRHEEGRYCSLTYAQLHEAVRRLAARLRAHGIQPGDRIAGFMPNIAEAVIAMLASSSLGAQATRAAKLMDMENRLCFIKSFKRNSHRLGDDLNEGSSPWA